MMNREDRKRPFDQTLDYTCGSQSCSSTKIEDWKRIGNKNVDQLHYYLTGEIYDCSFKVGCCESDYKFFKCHKMVLAMASSVFQKMFYEGNFKEATQEKDDPITLDRISSTAFDVAMKFIYGDVRDCFGNVETAVQVYRFAHEMQIPSLFAPLKHYLTNTAVPENVFSVLDLYNLIENDDDLKTFWEILYWDVKTALKSKSWLMLSSSIVERVLKAEFLPIDEAVLFSSLLDWGRYQALCTAGVAEPKILDAADDRKARDKILPLLKHIRFRVMLPKDFAEICKTKSNILTSDEISQIFMCQTLNTSERLPKELKNTIDCERRMTILLPYEFCSSIPNYKNASFTFAVNRRVYLVGLFIDQSDPNFGSDLSCMSITLRDSDKKLLSASGNLTAIDSPSGKVIELNKSQQPLKFFKSYTLIFTNNNKSTQYPNKIYKVPVSMPRAVKQPGLTVSFHDNSNSVICVFLTKLVFLAANE